MHLEIAFTIFPPFLSAKKWWENCELIFQMHKHTDATKKHPPSGGCSNSFFHFAAIPYASGGISDGSTTCKRIVFRIMPIFSWDLT